jgi:predicted nuclease with TOPRIM domain
MKLTDILGKEKISAYEAGQLVEHVGKLLQNFENAIVTECSEMTTNANDLISHVEGMAQSLIKTHDKVDLMIAQSVSRADEQFRKVRDTYKDLERKIEELPKFENQHMPYNLEQLFSVAERCNSLSDEQWKRVVELAKALGPRGAK